MKYEIRSLKPDEMEFELTISAKLKEWRLLVHKFSADSPLANDFYKAVTDMIDTAERHYIIADKDEISDKKRKLS